MRPAADDRGGRGDAGRHPQGRRAADLRDKFTTAAEAAPGARGRAPSPSATSPGTRPPSAAPRSYEDVTIDTQPSVHRHLTRGWPVSFEDGRGTWDDASTALQCADWFAFRDPGEQWERPYYQARHGDRASDRGSDALRGEEGLVDDFTPEWVEFLRANLQVPAYVEHGLWFALATIGRDCLSDSVATCVCLQAAMKQRSAQAIVLYAMDLEEHHGPFPIEAARDAFLDRAGVAADAAVPRAAGSDVRLGRGDRRREPRASSRSSGTLLRRELGIRAAAANGDTITPVLARAATQEWEWARAWTAALVRFLLEDALYGAANRGADRGDGSPSGCRRRSKPRRRWPRWRRSRSMLERLRSYAEDVLVEAGLPPRVEGRDGGPARAGAPRRRAATAPDGRLPAPRAPSEASPPAPTATYDFVGIVMAKSAEGDAVADDPRTPGGDRGARAAGVLGHPRATSRLEIPYREVSEQLGYEIDAYSIQHEMSTHYGRMVATDDALMLFSDPTEAMQYLMR